MIAALYARRRLGMGARGGLDGDHASPSIARPATKLGRTRQPGPLCTSEAAWAVQPERSLHPTWAKITVPALRICYILFRALLSAIGGALFLVSLAVTECTGEGQGNEQHYKLPEVRTEGPARQESENPTRRFQVDTLRLRVRAPLPPDSHW